MRCNSANMGSEEYDSMFSWVSYYGSELKMPAGQHHLSILAIGLLLLYPVSLAAKAPMIRFLFPLTHSVPHLESAFLNLPSLCLVLLFRSKLRKRLL
jgi:hypothetical protein